MIATKSLVASRERRVFISDCEGPISKNDNAFEVATHFILQGDRFFSLVSKYDDLLADIVKMKGYKAGDTLRLILPFLRAYGVTNEKMKEFSSRNILLVPGADDLLRFVNGIMPSFIISTSYEHYVSSICDALHFPKEKVYCTRLDMDGYSLRHDEVERLRALGQEIAEMPMVEIPHDARSISDLSPRDQATVERLDEIFWEMIPKMTAGRMLEEVNPVGGYEKANAVRDIARNVGTNLSNIMYVGDSITDVEPFRLVRENGGLAISFNGNQYAIREAEIAVLSNHATVTSILAYVFCNLGRHAVTDLAANWSLTTLRACCSSQLFTKLLKSHPEKPPKVELITSINRDRLTKESVLFRKTVRGEAIGRLG